ncbi:carboxylesterase [Rhodoferax lacus]|uniref:Carboxylesterase n=1 Tax=Rhodoferax lacus TaxID=2184758 RepID=A0A3E1RDT5_9BURK|nr:alpha/beta fold hydrolase [Rhodoferax lacus]RFO97536.1 carboxylesterase [Rhodoferax lacus]
MQTPLLPCFETETAASPTATVILLHGLGADGHDFAALVPELNLRGCQGIRFVFPHAPSMPVTVNGGYTMPAWYDITGTDLVSGQDAAGIQHSERAIRALIDQQIERGIPAERIVLSGFSQGAAMALHTGLRLPFALAGIMALSGYLPLAERLATERAAANAHTPIFLAHGTQDSVVIPQRGEDTRDALQTLGYPVQWNSYATGHNLTSEEVEDMGAFLRLVLPALA